MSLPYTSSTGQYLLFHIHSCPYKPTLYTKQSIPILVYNLLPPIQYQSPLTLCKDTPSESIIIPLYVIKVPRSSVGQKNSFPTMTFKSNIFAKYISRSVSRLNSNSHIHLPKPPTNIATDQIRFTTDRFLLTVSDHSESDFNSGNHRSPSFSSSSLSINQLHLSIFRTSPPPTHYNLPTPQHYLFQCSSSPLISIFSKMSRLYTDLFRVNAH